MALIPSLELDNIPFLERLATSSNFFAAEAIANEVAKRPATHLLTIANLCCKHAHPQAAAAGRAAVVALSAYGGGRGNV